MLYVEIRLGGVPQCYTAPREDAGMRVPDEVRQCVVYVGYKAVNTNGQETLSFQGTAFFVKVSVGSRVGVSFHYLVTAAHVARRLRGRTMIIRANTNDGQSQVISDDGPRQWYYSTDPSVDVAVTNFGLPDEIFERRTIPAEMLLSDQIIQERGIGVGDEVFMTGLFSNFVGTTRNHPIVRMGNIAMLPTERIPVSSSETIEAYLIEARSTGGLSGSPAFVITGIPGISYTAYLLGLVRGHWDAPTIAIGDALAVSADVVEKVNVGIAIVVPAKKILEVLNHPALVTVRREYDEKAQAQYLPTEDTSQRD